MKIADYLLQTLKINGLDTIFGNPGTTEIPLVSACEQLPGMDYVVALSEIAAVPMADGYARASRKPGVVNLHVAPGLGNGMGALYTAGIAGTPLLVLIGGQDRRFLHTDPILWGPVDRMAATVCKAVYGLHTRDDAVANVQRAVQAVMTPPYKPVALICPPDLLNEKLEGATPAIVRAPAPSGLAAADARRYAAWLAKARSPLLVVTEEVYWSGAGKEVEALATALDAPIHAAPYTGVLPVASRARGYSGYLPPSFAQIAQRLAGHDAMLLLGGRGFRTTLYSDTRIPMRKAWIGHGPDIPSFDGGIDLGCIADTACAVRAIREALPGRKAKSAAPRRAALRVPAAGRALHPTRAIGLLLAHYRNSVWIDESGLSTSDVRAMMKLPAGDYFINGSGGIGWGVPAAVGAALARRDRHTVAIIGDGSALYASEALWTAGHRRTRMTLVVLSNRRYATLNEAAGRLAGQSLRSFTIEPPVMDFGGLAQLYGWRYSKATTERELERALARDTLDRNTLLEVKLDPALKPLSASRHF